MHEWVRNHTKKLHRAHWSGDSACHQVLSSASSRGNHVLCGSVADKWCTLPEKRTITKSTNRPFNVWLWSGCRRRVEVVLRPQHSAPIRVGVDWTALQAGSAMASQGELPVSWAFAQNRTTNRKALKRMPHYSILRLCYVFNIVLYCHKLLSCNNQAHHYIVSGGI